MKKACAFFLIAILCAVFVVNTLSDCENSGAAAPVTVKDGTFTYKSMFTGKNAGYTFNYDESWFENSAEDFNPDLAKMSICVAMAAADTGSENIEELFENIKFDRKNFLISYPSPKQDTIGYAVASKETAFGTLIVCAIRGGNYGAEWADNFNVGTKGNHIGFEARAKSVKDAIDKHVADKKIDKTRVKIWITGFSRGGAVSNIAAHCLSEAYGNKNVFAYCFECPNAVEMSNVVTVDKNIFNIVNDIDFITYIAPSDWNMGRYGITCSIPSNAVTKNYESKKKVMSSEYGKIYSDAVNGTGPTDKNFRYISPEIDGQAKLIDSVFDSIASSMNREKAETELFVKIRSIIAGYYGAGNIQVKVDKIVAECVGQILKSIGGDAIFLFLRTGMNFDEFTSSLANCLDSHYPELCLAWVNCVENLEYTGETKGNLITKDARVEFSDVLDSAYYSEAVMWAVENGITEDIKSDKFEADTACTRAQTVSFIWRAAGCPEVKKASVPYADIDEDDYFYKAVIWATENGVVNGTSKTEFSPDETVTRGQAVTMLWRWKKPDPIHNRIEFDDVNETDYFGEAVYWAAEKDITKGTAQNMFSPELLCTRGHIITFLYRSTGEN